MAWSLLKVSGDPPKARGGHTMTLVERNIIVCGGQQHTAGTKFEYFGLEPYVLNTETLVWERPRVALGKGPAPRAWHTATPIDECLVFFGGRGEKKGTAKHIFNDLQCFDLTEMAWQPREARGRLPAPRYWHTAALVERKLLIWGGHNGKVSLSDLHVLDADSFLWSQPATSKLHPPPLSCHTCCALDGSLVVFGGMSCTEDEEGSVAVSYSSDTWTLDCLTLEWSRLRQKGLPPKGVAYHAAPLTPGGQLLVLGGWRGSVVPSDEMSALDMTTGVWHPVPVPGEIPSAMYGHTAVVVGSKVVVFGGWDSINPLNVVHVLDTGARTKSRRGRSGAAGRAGLQSGAPLAMRRSRVLCALARLASPHASISRPPASAVSDARLRSPLLPLCASPPGLPTTMSDVRRSDFPASRPTSCPVGDRLSESVCRTRTDSHTSHSDS